MINFDTMAYFTGVAVIGAVAGFGLVALVAGAYGLIALGFHHWSKKVFNGVRNWQAVYAWDKSGRPEWKCGEDRVFRMVPTAGPYEVDGEIIED